MLLRAPIILAYFLLMGLALTAVACDSTPEMVLESDIPNVQGFEPIVTRDIKREGEWINGLEVIYRGDLKDSRKNIAETRERFTNAGWRLVSQQSRGQTTILNFAKDTRAARVAIALSQIEPAMSPAVLTVTSTEIVAAKDGVVLTQPVVRSGIYSTEGFAPPPSR